ncbi:MAG: hypothetical protein WCR56_04875 [Bacilli bacterium]|jgi:galactose mutarotase-like enzyme
MPSIENEFLFVSVSALGAEIKEVYDKKRDQQLFYDGKGSWKCTDHVLFPFIGPDSHYEIDGKPYSCKTQHGFVRTSQVKVFKLLKDEIVFLLEDNEETRACYPFGFKLFMDYRLDHNRLIRKYTVINKGDKNLAFAIGDHPSYRVNFGKAILHLPNTNIQYFPRPDFVLQEPTLLKEKADYVLSKDDFKKYETIVIKNPLKDLVLDTGFGNKITYKLSSPYIAIWSPTVVSDQFVCIEPWWGLPVYKDMPLDILKRKDLNIVKEQKEFSSTVVFD